ncbi:hypothetical protein [Arthrobacter woluwensis]|uniref:Holin n=1 Tax=Arthrobacter woluwensis TaxID=156980 RepID=A0A1H4I459_9MICC|nr:hypothetical protein [Arthrobacter woluwensis]SEB28867.1 hypothetical protein SAMN04489745_0014 [Arthrobacter woluwensis]SEC79861.1 hypothetical protein SAMN04489745_3185 [Arthrobacter woluwensis]
MPDHRAATQTRYPWRAVARTALAVGLPLIAGAPLIYQAATLHDPAAATGLAAAVLGVAGAITRVMALPLVNDFLTKIGLGAEPKNPA